MPLVPLFFARVTDDGQLKAERADLVRAYLRSLAGQAIEFSIRKRRSKRSIQQNRWLWGVAYAILGEEWGYDRHEREYLHRALLAKCFGSHYDTRLGVEIPNVGSSHLSTKEFAEYMEWLVRFAAQSNVQIPLPNEVDLDAIGEEAA